MQRTVIGFGVAVGLAAVLVSALGPSSLVAALASVDPVTFALGPVAVLVALASWSQVQRTLFGAAGASVSPWRAFRGYGAGVFAKQVIPMGAANGPAVMAFAVDREVALGYDRTLAVVSVSELLGFAASVVLAAAGLVYAAIVLPPSPTLRVVQAGVAVAVVAILVLLLVLFYRRSVLTRSVLGVAGLLRGTAGRLSTRVATALAPDRVSGALDRYFATFDAVTADRRRLLRAYAFAQFGWICFALPLYTTASALSLDVPLPVVLFVVPACGLAGIVPLPGGLGGYELALAGLLVAILGLGSPQAAALAVLFRGCTFWFGLLATGALAAAGATHVGDLASTRETTRLPDGVDALEPSD